MFALREWVFEESLTGLLAGDSTTLCELQQDTTTSLPIKMSPHPSSLLPAHTAGGLVCGLLGVSMVIAIAVHPADILSWTIATVVAISLLPILLYFAYYKGSSVIVWSNLIS